MDSRSRVVRIVIEFTGEHEFGLAFEGNVTAYMIHGAAGVLASTAQTMMQDAQRMQRERVLEVARGIPADLRKPS